MKFIGEEKRLSERGLFWVKMSETGEEMKED